MSELPDVAPIRHEMKVERSHTVDGLFDDTIRGIGMGGRPVSLGENIPEPSSDWNKLYTSVKQTLQERERSADSADPTGTAALKEQLEGLNRLRPSERNTMLSSLLTNEKSLSTMEEAANKTREALRAGYMPAVIEQQYEVVKAGDSLSSKAILFELDSLRHLQEKQGKGSDSLGNAIEETRQAMAAPFIERARLATFLNKDQKPYQAEKMLGEALSVQIPPEALNSQMVRDLRKNASEELNKLRVQNNLVDLFDKNLSRLDIANKDGIVTEDEIKSARASSKDENFKVLADFLSDNYKDLSGRHWSFFGKAGITRSDILDYAKERSRTINDLKLD